jgi:hypothetical protein
MKSAKAPQAADEPTTVASLAKDRAAAANDDDDDGSDSSDSSEEDSADNMKRMTETNKNKLNLLRSKAAVVSLKSVHDRTTTKLGMRDADADADADDKKDESAAAGADADAAAAAAPAGDAAAAGDNGAAAAAERERLGFFGRAFRRLEVRKMVTNLEAAFIESYRGLVLLRNFGELNKMAIDKILKKHDKQLGTSFRESWQSQNCYQLTFSEQRLLSDIMREMELIFATSYTQGHRTEAMQALRVPDEDEHDVEAPAFQFGVMLGISVTFLAIAAYVFGTTPNAVPAAQRESMFIMYRGFFMAIVLCWFWGGNMWLWERYRVNYAFIFEFNPREFTKHITMWRASAMFSVLWSLFFLVYALHVARPAGFTWLGDIPIFALPLTMLIVFGVAFVAYSVRSGFWLLRTLGRIVTTPATRIVFRDFYVADQLISLSIVLADFEYIACFYLSDVNPDFASAKGECLRINVWIRPLIASLPAFLRGSWPTPASTSRR